MKENRRFFVRAYLPVDPENIEMLTWQEAQSEIENASLMQPENIYQIVEVIARWTNCTS